MIGNIFLGTWDSLLFLWPPDTVPAGILLLLFLLPRMLLSHSMMNQTSSLWLTQWNVPCETPKHLVTSILQSLCSDVTYVRHSLTTWLKQTLSHSLSLLFLFCGAFHPLTWYVIHLFLLQLCEGVVCVCCAEWHNLNHYRPRLQWVFNKYLLNEWINGIPPTQFPLFRQESPTASEERVHLWWLQRELLN